MRPHRWSAAAWVAVAGTIATAATVASAFAAGSQPVQQQVRADPRGEVLISNVAGTIDVIGWEQRRVAASAGLSGPELGLEVRSRGSGRTEVTITGYTHHGFGPFSPNGEAYLTVHVPRQSSVTINAVSASVQTTGVSGVQHLHSVSGLVRAGLDTAAVSVDTVSGAIDLSGDGHNAHVEAGSVSGSISVAHGGGDLDARTVSGALQVSLSPAHEVRLRSTSGDIRFSGSLARDAVLDAHSISGRVRIAATSAAGFAYQLRSFSGTLGDCFGVPPQDREPFGPGGRQLSGTRGAGGAQIRVRTLSGTVSLCDR